MPIYHYISPKPHNWYTCGDIITIYSIVHGWGLKNWVRWSSRVCVCMYEKKPRHGRMDSIIPVRLRIKSRIIYLTAGVRWGPKQTRTRKVIKIPFWKWKVIMKELPKEKVVRSYQSNGFITQGTSYAPSLAKCIECWLDHLLTCLHKYLHDTYWISSGKHRPISFGKRLVLKRYKVFIKEEHLIYPTLFSCLTRYKKLHRTNKTII